MLQKLFIMKWTKKEIEILQTYYLDHSAEECIKKFNLTCTVKALQKKARELGINKNSSWTEEEIKILKQLWPIAKSKKELIDALPKHSHNSMMCKAQELGIKAKINRKRIGSLEFLNQLNSKSAYWWGFIMADGCLTPKGELCITISDKDLEYLSVLQSHLNCNLYHTFKVCSGFSTESGFVTIRIQDKEFQNNWYDKLNYINPKTSNPPNLNIFYTPELLIYFLIGLIDGDGSIWRSNQTSTNKGSLSIRIEMHPNWKYTLEELFQKIYEFYGIKFNIRMSKRGYVKAEIAGIEHIKKLYTFVKKENCDFLDRKWHHVIEFLSQ